MTADYKIVLDACVLANARVCDLYPKLAESPRMLIPRWSDKILEETYTTHTEKLGWDTELADSFQKVLKKVFPDARISGYEELIPLMANDEKDRHVLAAAVKDKVDLIVTFNLKDFKPKHLDKWDIKAVHPQDYLLSLYSINPAIVFAKVASIAAKRKTDLESVLIKLGVSLPVFSEKLLEDMGAST
ncbi:MAG: PIN domain-containing protein [Balneolales bacterium]|nr:PIN domain-containing protein [Balneolales bacterium]